MRTSQRIRSRIAHLSEPRGARALQRCVAPLSTRDHTEHASAAHAHIATRALDSVREEL